MARSAEKGALVIARYPAIKVVIGDLDSTDLIVAQSALADIVISAYIYSSPSLGNKKTKVAIYS